MSKDLNRSLEVLLVEDNPGDARLAKEAFKDGSSKSPNRLHLVVDGVQAMQFLRREGDYADAPQPNIILLDLNLPRKDGREVLEEIKTDPELKKIPVLIMTTSHSERDILQSYELQANAYLTKPIDFDEFMGASSALQSFWFQTAELPPTCDGES